MFSRYLAKFSTLSATTQFFFARSFYDWAIYIFDAFYMTYVFKESGEVQEVVYNILITLLMVMVGFALGSFFMKKVGVERNLRLSFILYIFTGVLGIYLVNVGMVSFLLISFIRGIAEGFFWASSNIVELSGLPYNSRSKFYSLSQGVNGLFNIVAPITLGFLLTKANSLMPSFILFTIVCLIAVFLPFRFNINEKLSIDVSKFKRLFKHKELGKFLSIKMILSASWMIDWLLAAIVPFVILGNELNMGIYLTITSLLGVTISLFTHKLSVEKKAKFGKPLIFIAGLADFFVVIFFNPVMLYVNTIILTLTGSITSPLEFDLSTRISNSIDPKDEMGVELNLFQEFVYTMARIIVGVVVLGVIAFGLSVVAVLKVLVLVIALLKIVNYLMSVKFLKL